MRLVNFRLIKSYKFTLAVGRFGYIQRLYKKCLLEYLDDSGIYQEFNGVFTKEDIDEALNHLEIRSDGLYLMYPFDRNLRYMEHGGEDHKALYILSRVARIFREVFK